MGGGVRGRGLSNGGLDGRSAGTGGLGGSASGLDGLGEGSLAEGLDTGEDLVCLRVKLVSGLYTVLGAQHVNVLRATSFPHSLRTHLVALAVRTSTFSQMHV